MSSYLNTTTGECISGTCKSIESFTLTNYSGGGYLNICLFAGILLLIGAIILKIKEKKQ